MALYKVNESFSAKIQEAIISVCIENYSSQGIEVDGIVCVSFKNPASNCVVKIHKILSKQQKLANLLKSSELQNNQINSSEHWSNENLFHNSSTSNADHVSLDNQNDEQIYFYEDSVEPVENSTHNDIIHEQREQQFRNSKFPIQNQDENSESQIHFERFCANSRQRSNRFSHENSRQDSIYSTQCSASSEFGDIIKSEQDETLQHDSTAEWNGSSSRKKVSKKNNLETIIERFSNHNNPIGINESNLEDKKWNESQDNYGENEFSMHIQNYAENDNDESEIDNNSVAKYGNPVCIDLSESDPDLFHVQSEIEARVNTELNNLDMSYKSFDGNVDGILYGTNGTESISKERPNSCFKAKNNGTNRTAGFSIKNIKSLSQIKKSLQGPFRKSRSQLPQTLVSSEQRKVYCKFCGIGFTNSGNKNRHERSTCGAVKYKCEFCASLFSRSDSRARHMLYCHGLAIKDRQSDFTQKKNVNNRSPNLKSNQSIVSLNSVLGTMPSICDFSNSEIQSVPKEFIEKQDVMVTEHSDNMVSDVVQETESHTIPVQYESSSDIPES